MKWYVVDMDGDYKRVVGSLKEARAEARSITGSSRATENQGNHFLYFRHDGREIYAIREDYLEAHGFEEVRSRDWGRE